MRNKVAALLGLVVLGMTPSGQSACAAGDPEAGAQVFRACAACHSLEPGRHLTGPSLAGVVGRAAGGADFGRYSEAMGDADLVWDHAALDAFLADPRGFLPGNSMVFRGLDDPQARADLIAYLEAAGRPEPTVQRLGMAEFPDLADLGPNNEVTAIRYCGDTYYVATATGDEHPFWEFNLRFKTDSSDQGPAAGQPVLIPGGMMGDRAFLIFADPAEISAWIEARC